ncbi:alpha/beta hydrolase [Pararhizobium haloflavum]|uniref:alpha/beta hydrolase n=1 Tax=Pararhizobium haloflavum TaxID=2037914 RepID=UPI000C1817E7|nr:alpha/beta hydrolase [Pararhizobium haloflavum]
MSLEAYIHRKRAGEPGSPILFVFHGTGGDENQFFDFAARLMPAATIVSPRGDVSEGGALRFFRRTGEGVYDMDDLSVRTSAMSDFVKAQREAANASRIIGLGYSNGANILSSMTFREPLFDAVMLMHPLIPFDPPTDARFDGMDVVITAGQRDPICPPPQTMKLAAHYDAGGADVDLVWHDGGHEIQQSELEAARRFAGRQ